MNRFQIVFITLQLLSKVAFGADLAAPPTKVPGNVIDMWLRRAAGPEELTKEVRGNPRSLDIRGLSFNEVESFDIQYEQIVKFRGINLRDLIGAYKPMPRSVDMLLLHFDNGMIVPVSLSALRADRKVFVALEMFQDGHWSSRFPTSVRIAVGAKDLVPINFGGNKLVIGSDWSASANQFTPWRHVSSLTGIEFIEAAAYVNSYSLGGKRSYSDAKATFVGRCHFCHAIGGYGATFGPDFIGAFPFDDPKGWRKVFAKVQVAESSLRAMRHAMPKQSDFKESDAKGIFEMVKRAKSNKFSGYHPSYEKEVKWE